MKEPLGETAHRPWPLPRRPWAFAMNWHDLLFMHWPVSPSALEGHIPRGLTLETWEGEAWLGVVPFTMTRVRPRFVPPIPGLSSLPELNVRTYVVAEDKPGVWFFSLDAASRLAVRAARRFFYLPYFDARMSVTRRNGAVLYESERTHRGASKARYRAVYRGTGPAAAGALERFLTERYCLYSAREDGKLYRCDIHHRPWPLETAEAEVEELDMTSALGIDLRGRKPLLHFSQRLEVVGWLLEPLG